MAADSTDVMDLDRNSICSSDAEIDVVIDNLPIPNLSSPNYNKRLPVYKYRSKILNLIQENSVSIITSTPGSGKTSQIPQYILDSETEQRRYCNIIVTQPRKIAAISVARFVAETRGLDIGTVIGHQVGLDKMVSPDTRLLYCTTGILLQKLIAVKSLNEYTHVILDEAHDRVKDMDFLFLLVRKFLRTVSSHVKVIVMSATMDVEESAMYFSRYEGGTKRAPPVLCIDEPTYDVDVLYPENIPNLQSLDSEEALPEPRFDKTTTEQIITTIKYIEEAATKDERYNDRQSSRGTILIFLPGYQDILTMDSEISRHFDSSHKFEVLPVHSEIAISDQWRIFKPSSPGVRKIILATNIAESSITVPDVKYVIDPCMTKELMTDERTGYTGLLLVWASKSSCDQRKGRCGRLSNGTCVRLVSRSFYNNLASVATPEFSRTPLESVVLYAKMLDIGPPGETLGSAMTPPSQEAVRQSMFRLFELGGLMPLYSTTQHDFNDGRLSFIGRLMAALPINVNLSKLIALGYVFGILEYCIIIAATSSVRQIFRFPFGDRLNLLRYKHLISGGSCSEMISGLNVFQEWMRHHDLGILKKFNERKLFARRHMIDIKRMEEAHRLYEDIKSRLGRLGVFLPDKEAAVPQEWQRSSETELDQASIDCLLLKVAIAGACYPNYFAMSPSNEREVERFLNCRDCSNCVRIQRIPSQNLRVLELNVQRALETTYGFQNLRVDYESGNLYIHFDDIEQNYAQGIVLDHLMSTKVHTDVLLAMSIRDVIVPTRQSDNQQGDYVDGANFQKFYVDRNIRVRGRHLGEFGCFTAIVVASSCPQWDVGERIECKLCGVKAPSDMDSRDQGVEAVRQCIIDKVVDAEVVSSAGHLHFVEVIMGGQRLTDCLVAGGLADVDTRCMSRSFMSLGRMRSPLKSILRGITKITRGYTASISVSDLNGHMVNLFPKFEFERMVVAAEVRRGGSEANLQLFNTTVMPPIAGLPYIILMLFCPAVQLRTDEFLSQYVGLVGGMGCEKSNAFFPDHDMDLEFDCLIRRKDVEKVNEIRQMMGHLLGMDTAHGLSNHDVEDVQRQVRVSLYSLLVNRRRPYRRPLDYSSEPYRWANYSSGVECGIFTCHRLPQLNVRPLMDVNYVRCLVRKERELREDSKAMRSGEQAYCYLCDVLLPSKGHVLTHFRSEMHRDNADVVERQSGLLRE